MGDRVGYRCSCPTCRRLTIGPTREISAPLLIAEAAHITAATAGGPRFDDNLTSEERIAIENGIWLCATCHTMVDKDRDHFSCDLLREWRATAEDLARREVEGEVMFTGFIDPAKAAAKHFEHQLQEYAPGRLSATSDQDPSNVPIVWIQLAATASLKELVNLNPAGMRKHLHDIKPIICSGWGTVVSRFGVQVSGYGGAKSPNEPALASVVQLFKDGSVAIGFVAFENVCTEFGFDYVKAKAIPWIAFEDRVLTSIGHALKIVSGLDVPRFAFVRLTVTGMKGYGVTVDPSRWIQHQRSESAVVQSTPSLICNFELAVTEIARPVLDEFWQNLGVWHSPSYDEQGEFIRKSRLGGLMG